MPAAARIGDPHTCPQVTGTIPHVGGPVTRGSADVITAGSPQARQGDALQCTGPPDAIATGSATVLVNGRPAARMTDTTVHGGVITTGEPSVLIGDEASDVATDPILDGSVAVQFVERIPTWGECG